MGNKRVFKFKLVMDPIDRFIPEDMVEFRFGVCGEANKTLEQAWNVARAVADDYSKHVCGKVEEYTLSLVEGA